jgi:hypothetical protein
MNKVLVTVYVPLIEQEYNLFIPVNRKIGLVKKILVNSIVELSDGAYMIDTEIALYNKMTNQEYKDDMFVIESDIRNGTKLILL